MSFFGRQNTQLSIAADHAHTVRISALLLAVRHGATEYQRETRSVRLRQESAHHSHSSILDTNTRTLLTEGQNSGRPIQFLMRMRLVPQCVLLISYVTASTADSTQLAGSLEGSPLTLIPASQVLASNQHPLQCKTRRKIMKTRTLVVGRLYFQAPTLILTSTRSLQIRQAVYSRFRRLSGTSIA